MITLHGVFMVVWDTSHLLASYADLNLLPISKCLKPSRNHLATVCKYIATYVQNYSCKYYLGSCFQALVSFELRMYVCMQYSYVITWSVSITRSHIVVTMLVKYWCIKLV